MKKLHLKTQLKPLHWVAKAFINNVMVTWDLIEAGVEISRRPSANLVLAWQLQLTTYSFESSHHDCSTDNTFHQSVYSFKKCFTIHLFPYFNQLFTTPVFPTNTEIPERCEEFLLP